MITEEIVDRYQQGWSLTRLATEQGCRRIKIREILCDEGVYRGKSGWLKLSPADQDLVRSRYANGTSTGDLAVEFGVHSVTIRRTVGGSQTQPSSGKGHPLTWSQEQIDSLGEQWNAGVSTADLASSMGVSSAAIHQQLRPHGYRPRKMSREWKPSRYVTKQGYVMVTVPDDDPMAVMRTRSRQISEHRLVMARHLSVVPWSGSSMFTISTQTEPIIVSRISSWCSVNQRVQHLDVVVVKAWTSSGFRYEVGSCLYK